LPERHVGRTLGKYRVDALVGSGGFAWVYKGFDPDLEIPVALKVLKPQFAGDETFEQRFRREASTAAKLRHPNIIQIYAVGRDGDAVYFAMDYLPTGLADRLEAVNLLPEEVVIRVGMDVASALGFAHREGVIHRDIKVDNILFDPHGNAIVADFGIARALSGYSGQTGTNMVVGTPQYFAPEQARAKTLDGRADIYSLGVTMYRAVTGTLPFSGDDWYEIARQHVEEAPPPPRSINPAISEEFERILLHCLEKHPDDRPATGDVLCQELAGLMHHTLERSALRTRSNSSEPTLLVRTPSPTPVSGHRGPSSGWWKAGGVALLLLGVAIPLIARRNDTVAPGSASVRDTTRPPPSDSPVGAAPAVAVDSLRVDSTPLTPPPPTFARLAVSAPSGARVLLNGAAVGVGEWRSDSLKPGRYEVAASLPSMEGCQAATDRATVTLRAGSRRSVPLEPHPCGQLIIEAQPIGAKFTLVASAGDDPPTEGTIPATLILPSGRYRLTATPAQSYCTAYRNDDVRVVAEKQTTVRFRMLCEKP
jgi:eukaryotic-like serine/threonine-protein kinase